MADKTLLIMKDLNELKREMAVIKEILLSFQMRKEETLDQEMKAWDEASDEVWAKID